MAAPARGTGGELGELVLNHTAGLADGLAEFTDAGFAELASGRLTGDHKRQIENSFPEALKNFHIRYALRDGTAGSSGAPIAPTGGDLFIGKLHLEKDLLHRCLVNQERASDPPHAARRAAAQIRAPRHPAQASERVTPAAPLFVVSAN